MTPIQSLDLLTSTVARCPVVRRTGRIRALTGNTTSVTGLSDIVSVGDKVAFTSDCAVTGEVIGVSAGACQVMVDGAMEGLKIGQPVQFLGKPLLFPHDSWLGRVIDGDGNALDGQPIICGSEPISLHTQPPRAIQRRALGSRLNTGQALFNTVLPIVRGQRVGFFSGSGVGKSSLLAAFAREMETDVVVIGLIGERGREVNEFVHRVLGKKGLARSVVVAATSEQSALARRRAAFSAMTIAEYFRNQGRHVLLMMDSITRLAEAHREIAAASGETVAMRGFPPSMVPLLAGFAERAGPGTAEMGDITALFTVLVSGSDMDEPVADTLRGLLDGHVVLSRSIAERGRFPAVDILQSVSRSLPDAANSQENALITRTRRALSLYEDSEIMIRSGLYQTGANAELDQAVLQFPRLDQFASKRSDGSIERDFASLEDSLAIGNSTTSD